MLIDPKTVTVFLDASPSGKRRAAHAVTLARRWGAHVVGVHVVFAGVNLHPSMCYVRGESAIDQVIIDERELDDVAEAGSALLGQRFRALCAEAHVTGEFRAIRRGHPAEDAIFRSLHSDLVIVGHPEPRGLPEDLSPERVLLASGVPLLVVPNAWDGESIGDRVLIGWNASPQARRAVADAMAFLVTAKYVTVLVVDPSGQHWHHELSGVDLTRQLARHGVDANVEQVSSHGSPIARIILGHAARHASDLLVVGAYSHARLKELVLGGTTRTLLAQIPVPVLISR